MSNNKEIIKDKYITIKVSKQEKELWDSFAKDIGISSTKLARNILMTEAESLKNKYGITPIIKAYIKYLEVTNQKEALKRIQSD